MRRLFYILIISLLISYPKGSSAEVFQYFDQEGTLIVTDNPYGIKKPKAPTLPALAIKPFVSARQQIPRLESIEDVAYAYYPVYGNNFTEAIASTNANGPYDNRENRRYAGQTRWNMGWSYKFSSTHKIEGAYLHAFINIYDFNFKSDIGILLPSLASETKLEPQDLKLWQDFITGLGDHENDHVRIARDPAYKAEALRKISGIRELLIPNDPRAETTELIRSAVEAETARIGHELIMTIKARNEEYDRITEHGIKPEMKAVFFGK